MSHLITQADNEYRLYVAGSGTDCLAYAKSETVVGGSEGWRVRPRGIAEHLEDFVVKDEGQALTALKALGLAYEAGGGG
ncbi:Uncharacterised protein [Mycobacteroides abscessus subsp. abscessus]|uniref:Uncharacterized protein n=2 Tax=Mycobacteroides abscessus TaxID=36809 RepID=A0AB33TBE2_9MYCO|nr:hypothetical protein [Mycobacteroides abscessus]SHT90635.1 Uncharacterised protein [Mycobacteroides abscessus subsp. bolletii]SKL07115.1 Uncharacterised protein [Mycobacteroides abscessus subsp. massiliense]QOF39267.1 hypothetical protein E3G66_003436 [Mycobacteroides abscessus]CPT61398.1 Uncharacterised protein [Mycobacteroides abscessus]CPT71249.1 Uncharacterised protein [Mycobacteroides abscessus]